MRLLVCALLLAATSAAADDPKPDAATLYEEGKTHFDLAEYSQAIQKWKDSYRISKEPLLLFNIAQAYRLSGNCAEANRFYLNYQRMVPKPANAAELAAAMEKCAGVEPATGDTEPVEPPKPVERPRPVESPKPPPPRIEHRDEDQGATLRFAGYGAGAVAVVAGAGAIFYALQASDKASKVAGQPNGTVFEGSVAATDRDGHDAQTRARVLGIVGVAALASGAVMWWLGHDRAHVDVQVSARHAGATLTCAF
jgi:tetratricopeptide (TPR) repeat protein